MKPRTKLELTWIGKETRPKLEPRILIEDPEKSYHAAQRHSENDIYDNRLICGDNLLALKALEQEFAGKIKCIYIDPPFNTGEAFELYEDGLEHSVWLDLMARRIQLLHALLTAEGTLFIHIDDNELGYLIVVCDEIFGRKNRINVITFKQSSASGPKAINPGLVTTANYILIYAKDRSSWKPNRIYQAVPRDARYNNFIPNYESPFEEWRLITLREAFAQHHGASWADIRTRFADKLEERISAFVMQYKDRVVQPALVRDKDVNENARAALQLSRQDATKVYGSRRDDLDDYYFLNGKQLLFYKNKVKMVGGKETAALAASNIWDDILSNNVHKEGGVQLPKGKKPEGLLERILSFCTNPGDIVLDSFLGSGTTAAVAHKMGLRWIGVELGTQCYTHCVPRLRRVIDGEDHDGITKTVEWKGGGGFRYYRLGPSLIIKDEWDNPVINSEFNAAMLAEAMCKLEGFYYAPSEDIYWIHGKSTETDSIYVTTQFMSREMLTRLSDEVGPERSLLICCSAFRCDQTQFPNLTIKKIPKAVLKKCEWGHDDYSLEIKNLPKAPSEPEEPVEDKPTKPRRKFGKDNPAQASLFDMGGEQ